MDRDIERGEAMAKHELKTANQIAEEIRRQAQGTAQAKGEKLRIDTPVIVVTEEPTRSGSHWILSSSGEAGRSYVEAAAIRVARFWDVKRP